MVLNFCLFFVVAATDPVAVKMRGMPWRVETEEIEQFWEGFAWVRDSIRIGELEGGRRTG